MILDVDFLKMTMIVYWSKQKLDKVVYPGKQNELFAEDPIK
jgi:hypothetical protein